MRAFGVFVLSLFLLSSACSGDGPATGEEGGPCSSGGECFGDLQCIENTCGPPENIILPDVHESTDEGSTDEGSTDEGSTDEGSTDEGSTDEGSTDEGSTDEGSTDEGSTDEGGTDEGSTDVVVVDPCENVDCGAPPEHGAVACVEGACVLSCDDHYALEGALCVDIDECATGNGECGDPLLFLCTNNDGAPPNCTVIDVCGDGVLGESEGCDDGNTVAGDCCGADCVVEASDTVCRESAEACDLEETCDGATPDCPPDVYQPASTICRFAQGECDAEEQCTGGSPLCPLDVFVPEGGSCDDGNAGTTNDACDGAGNCSGYLCIGGTVTNTVELEAFVGCAVIEGNLDVVSGSNLTDLSALSSLTTVVGYLKIRENTALIDLGGLSSLTTVEGEFYIGDNPLLTHVGGLSNLDTVGGDLGIMRNDALVNVNGLSNLTFIGGHLEVLDNDTLTNSYGLSNLTTLEGNLDFSDNPILTDIGLSNLTTVLGNLNIKNNDALPNIDVLSNLTSVGGFVQIRDNASLTRVDGLLNLTSLQQDLTIVNNAALTHLDGLLNMTSMMGLRIENNPLLTNVNGLSDLTSVGHDLTISDNASLTSIALSSLTLVNGDLTINNNAALCETLVDDLVAALGTGLVGTVVDIAGNDGCLCGNGEIDSGEECDDGNLISGDGCESDCTLPLEFTVNLNGYTWYLANKGQNCASACGDRGMTCIDLVNVNYTEDSCSPEHAVCPNFFDGLPCVTDGDGPRVDYDGDTPIRCRYRDNNYEGMTCTYSAGTSTAHFCACQGAEMLCGDGVMEGAEACDDGNTSSNDYCTEYCTLNVCGDGHLFEGVEECDDHNLADNDGCTSDCVLNVCGDGILNSGVEACDDGNTISGDGCEADCTLVTIESIELNGYTWYMANKGQNCASACGDLGMTCIDLVNVNYTEDSCSPEHAVCPNFFGELPCVTDGDGPRVDFDGDTPIRCRYRDHNYEGMTCTYSAGTSTAHFCACQGADMVCGDGVMEGAEGCDDGNTSSNDYCTEYCTLNVCGDGHLFEGVEECDDHNLADNDGCTSECVLNVCGDGILNSGVEACDDGNTVSGDGCEADCTLVTTESIELNGYTWYMANKGQNCASACNDMGMTCIDLVAVNYIEDSCSPEHAVCPNFFGGLPCVTDGDGPRIDFDGDTPIRCRYRDHNYEGMTCTYSAGTSTAHFCACDGPGGG